MRTLSTFVEVAGPGNHGVGKLKKLDRKQAEIEYFESPVGPRLHDIQAPVGSVHKVELSPQTRVFWFDPVQQAWRAGRVDGGLVSAEALKKTEDQYPVRFPNGQDAYIPISELYVRWRHPIEDPTEYLAARITYTPLFFDGRSRIVRYLSHQRAAFGGLTGLASAAIELLEHQVSTVRRILADPVQRYLLADEVGLGKTIEAAVLIRQHVIDQQEEAAVLVVTPAHLVAQWRMELATKFFLDAASPVHVLSEDEVVDIADELSSVTMLVVDEAHRPALLAFHEDPAKRRLYDSLRILAAKAPKLLLLSGTPVLHQEEGFLAMLHLLDPEGYPLSEREQFSLRVRERQTVADATVDLADDASSYFAAEALQRLETLFADDPRLLRLCQAVREHLARDTADPARLRTLRALRTHLSETYRLHRRLLRTRRDDPRLRDHLPHRTGAVRVEHEDDARREAFEFLDTWRLALPETDGPSATDNRVRLFSLWVAAALSHPRILARYISARLALLDSQSSLSISPDLRKTLAAPRVFDGEELFLRQRLQLIMEAAGADSRAQRFISWLDSNHGITKVVVFVDDSEVADGLAHTLRNALGTNAILRYNATTDVERAFEQTRSLTILVCDGSAEEGLNLQRYGATIVHFDLPLEPARIEQRIGRVDRLEARGRLRNVVFCAGCPYEKEWLTCLSETMRVFDRSIAPLQYSLAEATSRIRLRLLADGRAAIEHEVSRMRDPDTGLDAELRRIRAQESLDSVEGEADADSGFFATLAQVDERAETEGEKALNSWVTELLNFGTRRLEPTIVRYVHDLRRPTLLPLFETIRQFEDCIDRDPRARESKATLPLEPATFSRSTAERKHVGLLRVGHPLLNGLERLVRSDDRGTAFAMWRYVPKSTRVPRLFFRFDFLIETDLSRIYLEYGGYSLDSLRRRADQAFPVEYRTIWLDGDLAPVRNQALLKVLEQPYQKQPRADRSRDVNLRSDRWNRVDALLSIGDWGDLCHRARDVAEGQIRSDPKFKERCGLHARLTLDLAASVNDALKSRLSRLTGPTRDSEEKSALFELDLSTALASGIDTPSLRVDSAGAVVLAARLLEEP